MSDNNYGYIKRCVIIITRTEHAVRFHKDESAHSVMQTLKNVPATAKITDMVISDPEEDAFYCEINFTEEHVE